jgi:hypothetical protein
MEISDLPIVTFAFTFLELSLLNFYLRRKGEQIRQTIKKIRAIKTLELLKRVTSSFSEGSLSEILAESIVSFNIKSEVGSLVDFVNAKIPEIKRELDGISWSVKDLEKIASIDSKFFEYLRNSSLLGLFTIFLTLGYIISGNPFLAGFELATLVYMSYFLVMSFRLLESINRLKNMF